MPENIILPDGCKVIVHGTHMMEVRDESNRSMVFLVKSENGRWLPTVPKQEGCY